VQTPAADETIRCELEQFAASAGKEKLLERLSEVDPVTAARLHPNDKLRIIRALEVYLLSGQPISAARASHGFADHCYEYCKIGIAVPREELYRRINARVDLMVVAGLVEEVAGILAAGYSPELKAMQSIGYREICTYLAGEVSFDEAVRLIKRNTRHYAKRQLTWFQKENDINWVEYPESFDSIYNHVIDFLV
jgi:tRNA dimethylallyltransferase